MDGGLNGLTGRHARETVDRGARRERGHVPTQPPHTMVATVGERMLQLNSATITHVKESKSKIC